jgi:hypothetical protein
MRLILSSRVSDMDEYRSTYKIRVVVAKTEKFGSQSIGIIPPPANLKDKTPLSARRAGCVYIEDFMPQDAAHHQALGIFMDSFGSLESIAHMFLTKLARIDTATSEFMIANMGIKQIIDAISSISTLMLTDEGIGSVKNLTERLSSINSKRNIIVHGHWILELVAWKYKDNFLVKSHLLRCSTPSDWRVCNEIADLKNQKSRLRYCYDVKRIYACARDADSLRESFSAFMRDLDSYIRSENLPQNSGNTVAQLLIQDS